VVAQGAAEAALLMVAVVLALTNTIILRRIQKAVHIVMFSTPMALLRVAVLSELSGQANQDLLEHSHQLTQEIYNEPVYSSA
jgi:hypothetical protein